MKVRLRKTQLDYFRSRARATDKEQFAYLVGEVNSPELVTVSYFAYPKLESSTTQEVQPDYKSWKNIRDKATKKDLVIVGSIHSHPNWWPVMSPADHEGHITEGNRICGVCAVMGRKTKAYFWVTESCLPCTIEYSKA
jgi:proteasome lid subunit RPN8/RPN11